MNKTDLLNKSHLIPKINAFQLTSGPFNTQKSYAVLIQAANMIKSLMMISETDQWSLHEVEYVTSTNLPDISPCSSNQILHIPEEGCLFVAVLMIK